MKKIKGRCLCGNVSYECSAEPLIVAACHCTHCQKQSGSAFSVNVGVPAEAVTVLGDSLKTYADTGATGEPVLRKFCGDCGSPILSDIKSRNGVYFIKAGTLDDSSWVVPGAEIWCDSKKSWGEFSEEVPKLPSNPPR